MASFAGAFMRLVFKKQPREGRVDEERPEVAAPEGFEQIQSPPRARGSQSHHHQLLPSWLGGQASSSIVLAQENGRFRIPADDSLTLFRLMLGITSSPYLGFSQRSPVGTRPAPNVGIYSRVVHAEQQAADSYKVFKVVINACYFLQIVVGAALTAMGAASANNKAITAFGAINTVMAGFLTFLRGSGLPGRLKYYENEWKKIREFIEQRERDFSRQQCTLDVYDVVETIETMYENTKAEIELHTQDGFAGGAGRDKSKVGGIDVSKLEGIAEKLQGHLDGKAKGTVDDVEKKKNGVMEEVSEKKAGFMGMVSNLEHRKDDILGELEKKKESITNRMGHHEQEMERGVRAYEKNIVSEMDDTRARLEREISQRRARVERETNERMAQVDREAAEQRAEVDRQISMRRAQAEREATEQRVEMDRQMSMRRAQAEREAEATGRAFDSSLQSVAEARDRAVTSTDRAMTEASSVPERLHDSVHDGVDSVRASVAGQMREAASTVESDPEKPASTSSGRKQ